LIVDALYKDLRRHKNESILGEVIPSKEEINDALEHLEEWAKDEKVVPALVNRVGVTCLKRKEPKGKLPKNQGWTNNALCFSSCAKIVRG